MRHCTKCEKTKPDEAFYASQRSPWCKACRRKRNKENMRVYTELNMNREYVAWCTLKHVTPAWADREAIKEVYHACPRTKQVDHILPVRGKHVTGLHVHTNLQHLTKSENSRKGNR